MRKEHRRELGKRVATAVISYMAGVKSMDYFFKTYLKDEQVGEFWCEIGEFLLQAAVRSQEKLAPPLELLKPITDLKQ